MRSIFSYQSEKMNVARSCLMAPHPRGEAKSFAEAFFNCSLAFDRFDINLIDDDDARKWAETILQFMDTTNLRDSSDQGLYQVRAEQMSIDEKMEFSRSVDELASWFNRQLWKD